MENQKTEEPVEERISDEKLLKIAKEIMHDADPIFRRLGDL